MKVLRQDWRYVAERDVWVGLGWVQTNYDVAEDAGCAAGPVALESHLACAPW